MISEVAGALCKQPHQRDVQHGHSYRACVVNSSGAPRTMKKTEAGQMCLAIELQTCLTPEFCKLVLASKLPICLH